jgi:hypothetical protein
MKRVDIETQLMKDVWQRFPDAEMRIAVDGTVTWFSDERQGTFKVLADGTVVATEEPLEDWRTLLGGW